MADMFSDLVPTPPALQKPAGMFDDLVQQAKVKDKASQVTFADLHPRPVPNVNDQGTSAPSVASNIVSAVASSASTFGHEFALGRGEKSAPQLWLEESLPANLYHGIKRKLGKEEPKNEDHTDPGIVADLKALGVTATDHPGILYGSFVKSIITDPELLLPWLWRSIPEATAARVAQAARAMGASATAVEAAEAGGMAAGRAVVGASAGASVEAAHEFKTGDYSAGKVATAAEEWAVFSAPGPLKARASPKVAAADAAHAERVEAATMTPADKLSEAVKDDPINPEFVAELKKEKEIPPHDARDRVVKAVKQSVVGGAAAAGVGYLVASDKKKKTGVEMGLIIGAGLPLLKALPYRGVDIAPLVNARNGQVRVIARSVYQFQRSIEKLLPDKAQREALAEMIDRGVEPAAGTAEHEAYTQIKKMFAELGTTAKEAGVIDQLRENYISHIVEGEIGAKTGIWQKVKDMFSVGSGQSRGAKPFSRERKHETFEDLQNAIKDSGLTLKTKDASEIAGIYANAVYKSIADRNLLNKLQEVRLPDGSPIVQSVAEDMMPAGWKRLGNPSLSGLAVHPDIAGDLQFVFSHTEPNSIFKAASALTSAVKRVNVAISLFHAKTLGEGFVTAGGLQGKMSPSAALRMFREGGNNDSIEKLIKGGLIVGTPEDVAGHEVQNVLSKVGDFLNEKLPLKGLGVGYAAKKLATLDKNIERFTFGYLQTGFKLSIAHAEYERMVRAGIDDERAARSAASYANDIFGSLDWYRVATDTESHIMRKLGAGALNSNARKVLQLAFFAPDWTAATFRSLAKALPGGTDDVTAQLHRRYAVKSALFYFTIGNAINQALSGHDLWHNKRVDRIELGDGRTMQFSKHETEPLTWLTEPVETSRNKLATLPAAFVQTLRTHDVNAAYKKPQPTPVEDFDALLPRVAPISIQQYVQNGFSWEDAAGFAGYPIYGEKPHAQAK